MAINAEGLTIKRYDEILAGLESSLRSYLGSNIDLSENALLGIINIIYANSQAEQWEMAQAVYNAFNIEGAIDKQLDDLVKLVGLSRLPDSFTTGTVELGGDDGTLVPQGTEFQDTGGKSVFLDTDILLSGSDCFKASLTIPTVFPSFEYIISVNGTSYSYTTGLSDVLHDILDSIAIQVNNDSNATWTATYTQVDGFMSIVSGDITFPMFIHLGAGWSFTEVFSIGNATTETVGAILFPANTVTVIIDTVTGLTSVNNAFSFSTGRLEESDDELRARHGVSTSIIGSSSPDTIEAQMRQLEGVSYAEVFENTAIVPNARGIPPKAFEVVIEGGSDPTIADKLYSLKPAGIQTFGNTAATVVDLDGNIQGVFYTRPESLELFVAVEYDLYNEEIFPTNGTDLIREAVVAYATTLALGEDVFAQRFFGTIYSNIDGISALRITLGTSVLDVTYSVIPMDVSQRANIIGDNVTVNLGSF